MGDPPQGSSAPAPWERRPLGAVEAIDDYALIGDGRSAALVSRRGSIDWLCWPRFDSPPLFARLLDPDGGGWQLAPPASSRISRRYVEATNVLQTVFDTAGGTLVLTDLMPVASEEDTRRLLMPEHELVRGLECTRGEVEVDMVFDARPDYGRARVRPRPSALGIRMSTHAGLLLLQANLPMQIDDDGRVRARARLRAGDRRFCSLTLAAEWPAIVPPIGDWTRASVDRSIQWWQRWAGRLTYGGPARDAVVRSALALKLLMFAPSGAVVAAPTTSLPERIGGDLNWDYRFCWLRDASLTVRAMFGLGYHEEAEAFVGWLLHATRLTRPELRILYDVYGKAPPREQALDHLRGYADSRPVRVGNAAAAQLQLDVYGEVIDAVSHFCHEGGRLDRETQKMLRGFGEFVCRHWREPDEGIWEPRSGPAHNTHSRVLCWTALDRLLQLGASGHVHKVPVEAFATHREQIHRDVVERAWNAKLSSYVAQLDGEALDASLLLLPWYGFEAATSARMRGTYARIRERLGAGGSLLYRNEPGAPPREGAFGICSFWGAEYLALGGGTLDDATEAFERLVGYGNDLNLFAEEIDPATGANLGNFPQAFTHVGLVNAALSLDRRSRGLPPVTPRNESGGAARSAADRARR